MDFSGLGIPDPETGFHKMSLAICHLTKYVVGVPTDHEDAETAIRTLEAMMEVVDVEAVWVDGGGAYVSEEFAAFCDRNGITLVICAPYSPQAKGAIERVHRVIRKLLATALLDGADIKEGYTLPGRLFYKILQQYNRRFHSSIGTTPFTAMRGRIPGSVRPFSSDQYKRLVEQLKANVIRMGARFRKDATVKVPVLQPSKCVFHPDSACCVIKFYVPGRPAYVSFTAL